MDKRKQILATTESLLAEKGFYSFSMQNLADSAGVAAGTIYRYFASKEILMKELHKFLIAEAAKQVFDGWQDNASLKEKYNLVWDNTLKSVLANPQRLAVCEMLFCIPEINHENVDLFEDEPFQRLCELYQDGITSKRFLNLDIYELSALSFDTSISLAKKITRGRLKLEQANLPQVREASWNIIQNPLFNQQD